MAFNFCIPQLKPIFTCDKPSTEGYEVSNLANSSPTSNAFMPASFIKPPYCITVQFPCPIELHRIVINGKHGRQNVRAVEIFSGVSRCCLDTKNNRLLNSDQVADNKPSPLQVNKPLGRANQSDNHFFVFENTRFRRKFAHLCQMPEKYCPESNTPHRLNSFQLGYLMCVTEIGVKVLYAGDGGMGAIQWLEVWGQPSNNIPNILMHKLIAIHSDICKPRESPDPLQSTPITHKEERVSIPEDSIPADFIDPLTNDLMTFPVLLPCGQSIDATTHDKYVDQEAKWGRSPNDPFTGQPYTGLAKLIPNSALKARIDQFLLENGEKLKLYRLHVKQNSASSDAQKVSTLIVPERPTPQDIKRKAPSDETLTNRSTKAPRLTVNNVPTTLHPGSTHGERLSRSLNTALYGTLSSLPSFLSSRSQTEHPSTSRSSDSCSKCSSHVSERYRLPCTHTVCRTCALDVRKAKKDQSCLLCGVVIDVAKITKCHSNLE